MAELTVQDLTLDGMTPAPEAPSSGGDYFTPRASGPGASIVMHLINSGTADQTATVDDPTTPQPAQATSFNPDVEITVPAGGEWIGALKPLARFVDPDGRVNLTWSDVANLTVAVYRVLR